MHILLIHQAFVSPNEAGGTRHYEFARYCADQGHKVTIVASTLSYFSGSPVTSEPKLVSGQFVQGINVLRAYTVPSLHRSFTWRFVSFLSFMVTSVIAGLQGRQVDVVMGTSPPLFQAISAWTLARLRRRTLLLEIRDLWPAFAISLGVLKHPLLIVLSFWLERFLYRQADHLIVNSPAYRDHIIDRGIPAEKISLIPNGVDATMFEPAAKGEHIRQEWNLNGKFIVTYSGALGISNDIPTILRAAQRLQDEHQICFVLVGDGKERKNLERIAQEYHLTNVLFAGPHSKVEMPAILAASDVCIATLKDIPMFRTTYPNKVFDYMAAGRPTILAIDGVIRKVVEAANGGIYITPGDDQALAEAIKHMYNDQTARQTMGQAARSYVVEHFNRHTHAQLFEQLVASLVKSKKVP
jgi:glycosyltransferase involved in cell wall biosynthesis